MKANNTVTPLHVPTIQEIFTFDASTIEFLEFALTRKLNAKICGSANAQGDIKRNELARAKIGGIDAFNELMADATLLEPEGTILGKDGKPKKPKKETFVPTLNNLMYLKIQAQLAGFEFPALNETFEFFLKGVTDQLSSFDNVEHVARVTGLAVKTIKAQNEAKSKRALNQFYTRTGGAIEEIKQADPCNTDNDDLMEYAKELRLEVLKSAKKSAYIRASDSDEMLNTLVLLKAEEDMY